MTLGAWEIKLTGVVQGVGFRPYVYRLARNYDFQGWVLNSSQGLTVWVEGEEKSVNSFYQEILTNPPPLARIMTHSITEKTPEGWNGFTILLSKNEGEQKVLVSPDIAACPDCLREITDPQDRRYRYPFTNCTNCGPRYTIIRDVPYDRPQTTMDKFPMCPDCLAEYSDPQNRRFHAQPNACKKCGPQVKLVDRAGSLFPGLGQDQLVQGEILAVKGIGGFHLACNALNAEAVRELRRRKHREAKPFAVMCRDLEVVCRYCHVSDREEELLRSPAAPIVILQVKDSSFLAKSLLSPGLNTLGVMLPYTPLHHLLLAEGPEMLVMTSANVSDDPLITDNLEAMEKLQEIADYFLLHDREIYNRCDDSVTAVVNGEVQVYRRARGYVPLPVSLEQDCQPILACGGEIKNTFCLAGGRQAFLSQHMGDLNNFGNYEKYVQSIPLLQKIAGIEPAVVAFDMHPNYTASQYARSLPELARVEVQHHHAHLASCMAENHLQGTVLGVICDGTGYGTDGTVWGFEFLSGGYENFTRLAHLDYVPLPGGDAAIRRPVRMAFSYLYHSWGEQALAVVDRFLPDLTEEEKKILKQQLDQGINTLPASSCGRLFDAVSALLGICSQVSYEGQAAVELEAISQIDPGEAYPFAIEGQGIPYRLVVKPLLAGILSDLEQGLAKEKIAGKFQAALANMIVSMVQKLSGETGLFRVVLSGGTFQNRLLLPLVIRKLTEVGLEVYYHHEVPANDGGISLGQAVIANEVIKSVSGRFRKNT